MMMPTKYSPLTATLAIALSMLLGCGQSSPGAAASQDAGVVVRPPNASVLEGGTTAFSAAVTGTVDVSVTWSVLEGSAGGTVSGGVYVAPATAGTYHVVAKSVANGAEAQASVVVLPPGATPGVVGSVYVHDAATTTGKSVQLVADVTVSGTVDMSLAWSMATGSAGVIDAVTGVYTAPATAGRYKVWATSKADPTKKDYGFVDVTALGGTPGGGGGGGGTSTGATYYVATNGSDSNDGRSAATPFATFRKADSVVSAGQTVQVRGGTYAPSASPSSSYMINLAASGTSGHPITWEPYSGETVTLDGSGNSPATDQSNPGNQRPNPLLITGDYVTVKGFHVVNSPATSVMISNTTGVIVDGLHITHSYANGINIYNSDYYTITNNTIYDCFDYGASGGGNSDGIHANQDANFRWGNGVISYNDISYVSDDGIDLWGQGGNIVEHNIIHHAGKKASDGTDAASGDGNGLKLGGSPDVGGTQGNNIVRFNVAYQNRMRGVVTNGAAGNTIYNNTAWGHDSHSGYTNSDGLSNTFYNNINSRSAGVDMAGALRSHNSWDLGITDWVFVSTDPASPDFLHLASASPCINAGTPVGNVPYLGAAPDLGAFEAR